MEPPPGTAAPALVDAFGRSYALLRLLGQGGFGEVHLARVRSPGGLEQHVAVKLLHRGLDPRGQAVERLRDEARLLASLRHPVVLSAHDLVELGGKIALVTEFIEGEDLSACIDPDDPRGRMPPSAVLEVVEQVASALDAAYLQLRVVHRDVKPANLRIGTHGTVKLLDFGIARSALEDRSAQTASQMLVGTLRYLAPERFDPKQSLEPASDVFSLGCVLYEGVTGEPFFGTLRMPEMVRLSISPEGWGAFVERRLGELDASAVPDGLRELLADMVAYDVDVRPTAGDVARRCEGLMSGAPGQVRLSRWCRDRAWPESPIPPRSTTPEPGTPKPMAEPQPGGRVSLPRTPRSVRTPPPTSDPVRARSETAAPTSDWLAGSLEVASGTRSSDTQPPSTSPSPAGFRWARWAAAVTAAGGVAAAGVGTLIGGVLLMLALQGRTDPTEAVVPVPSTPTPEIPAAEVPVAEPIPAVVEPVAPVVAPPEPTPTPDPSPRPVRKVIPAPDPTPPDPIPADPTPAEPVLSEPVPAPPDPVPVQARPTRSITVASVPGGAEIWLVSTGELLGTTPLVRPLPLGEVAVRLRAPDGASTERTLKVSRDGPGRYVWYIAENRFDAGN